MKRIKIYILLSVFSIPMILWGQEEEEKPDRAWLFGASIGMNDSQGDWAEQFANNFTVGAHVSRKYSSNWSIGLEWDFLFGGDIADRNGALRNVLTEDGNLININGSYGQVNINQRGSMIGFGVEKTIPWLSPNLNSGINLALYGGYTWHWLNVDNVGNDSPQIIDEYEKGYDRLSQGPHLRQSIGYIFLSENRLVNFKVSFELTEIWSRDMRAYYYPIGELSGDTQFNLLYSLKLKWYIPIYLGGKKQEYYID